MQETLFLTAQIIIANAILNGFTSVSAYYYKDNNGDALDFVTIEDDEHGVTVELSQNGYTVYTDKEKVSFKANELSLIAFKRL